MKRTCYLLVILLCYSVNIFADENPSVTEACLAEFQSQAKNIASRCAQTLGSTEIELSSTLAAGALGTNSGSSCVDNTCYTTLMISVGKNDSEINKIYVQCNLTKPSVSPKINMVSVGNESRKNCLIR